MVFSRKHLIDLSIKAHHFKGMNISITWHFITTFLFFYVLARTKSAPLSSLLCRFLTFTNRLTKYFKPFLSIEYIFFTSYNFSWEHFSSSRIFVKHRKLTLTETASYLKSMGWNFMGSEGFEHPRSNISASRPPNLCTTREGAPLFVYENRIHSRAAVP